MDCWQRRACRAVASRPHNGRTQTSGVAGAQEEMAVSRGALEFGAGPQDGRRMLLLLLALLLLVVVDGTLVRGGRRSDMVPQLANRVQGGCSHARTHARRSPRSFSLPHSRMPLSNRRDRSRWAAASPHRASHASAGWARPRFGSSQERPDGRPCQADARDRRGRRASPRPLSPVRHDLATPLGPDCELRRSRPGSAAAGPLGTLQPGRCMQMLTHPRRMGPGGG